MLLYLPIVILATISPMPVSDAVPKFDTAKECHFESESSSTFDRCFHDEAVALQQLEKEWPQFVGADRSTCFTEATVDGFDSYVELLICLEMSRDVRNEKADTRGPRGGPKGSTPPEVSVIDKHE